MSKGKHVRTPNDQRSDAFNKTSAEYKARMDHNAIIHDPATPEYQADLNNKSRLMNPKDVKYQGSEQK